MITDNITKNEFKFSLTQRESHSLFHVLHDMLSALQMSLAIKETEQALDALAVTVRTTVELDEQIHAIDGGCEQGDKCHLKENRESMQELLVEIENRKTKLLNVVAKS